jgi:N-ethylmaleimide reductase
MSVRLPNLLSPYRLGSLELPNRVVMAPMTRSRAANAERAPFALHAEYYRQRASAGLLITEATSVSPQGVGYVFTPGLWSDAPVEGWKLVTRTVHEAGGRIFAQLWHVGRVSHRAFQPEGALPVSSSAVAYEGKVMLPDFSQVPVEAPRALETHEIAGIVKDFAAAAQRAKDAGFDGIELHGANSYLIDQFLRDGCNQRTDAYGGSIENRCRFALEVLDATIAVWGPGRVGIRLSPTSPWNGMSDSDPKALFTYLSNELNKRELAFVHVNESAVAPADVAVLPTIRATYKGTVIACTAYTAELGEAAVAEKRADLIGYGVPYIANPDLVERFAAGAELNAPDQATFYGGAEKGYTDYPTLAAKA